MGDGQWFEAESDEESGHIDTLTQGWDSTSGVIYTLTIIYR
jgi:hypothetical protein